MPRQSISGLKCKFGGESSSGTRRSISLSTGRSQLDANEIDELLVGNRVEVELVGYPAKKERGGDVSGQTLIGGGNADDEQARRRVKIKGIAECMGAGIKPETYSFSLRFDRDIEKLELLAGREGEADIKRAGKIEKPEKKSGDESSGDAE